MTMDSSKISIAAHGPQLETHPYAVFTPRLPQVRVDFAGRGTCEPRSLRATKLNFELGNMCMES